VLPVGTGRIAVAGAELEGAELLLAKLLREVGAADVEAPPPDDVQPATTSTAARHSARSDLTAQPQRSRCRAQPKKTSASA
jgi:hypothetical protein